MGCARITTISISTSTGWNAISYASLFMTRCQEKYSKQTRVTRKHRKFNILSLRQIIYSFHGPSSISLNFKAINKAYKTYHSRKKTLDRPTHRLTLLFNISLVQTRAYSQNLVNSTKRASQYDEEFVVANLNKIKNSAKTIHSFRWKASKTYSSFGNKTNR